METTSAENSGSSALPSSDADHHSENLAPHHANHDDVDLKCDFTNEEVREIMEVIAATGKFWHDWDVLKRLLSFRLKQALAEYPESQMVTGIESQQSSLPGETYPELVKRLDEALLCFIEGPPFTLQRLCEILLAPRTLYPHLLKLGLALEKNLLVTSTLMISTDPYPSKAQKVEEPDKLREEDHNLPDPVQNGTEPVVVGGDEEMVEADAEEDGTKNDMEMQEDKTSEASESGTEPISISDPSKESCSNEDTNSTNLPKP